MLLGGGGREAAKEIGDALDRMGMEAVDRGLGRSGAVGASVDEIELVYRRLYPEFLRVSTAIVGDEVEAADAIQDAFASVLRSRGTLRGRGSLEAWVWRVVVNAARKRRARRPLVAVAGRELAGVGASVDGAGFGGLVAGLSERQRLVLFLRYYADLDYRSIGRVLGIRSGTVGATLNAAHARIRTELGRDDA
jgi:DNA-directed RNA polymerase specialized sigma24 family protein